VATFGACKCGCGEEARRGFEHRDTTGASPSAEEIARDLKVSRNTVRKVLRSGETSFEYEREVQPRPKLGRWTEELDSILSATEQTSARRHLT
jgi:transposase